MKRYGNFKLIWLILVLLTVSGVSRSQSIIYEDAPGINISFNSREDTVISGYFDLQLIISGEVVFTKNYAEEITIDTGIFKIQAIPGSQQIVNDSQVSIQYRFSYNTTSLPIYLTEVKIFCLTDDENGATGTNCYIYFTPYGTIEILNEHDFANLNRFWFGNDGKFNQRIQIEKDSIPVSNINLNDSTFNPDSVYFVFKAGLGYAIPMKIDPAQQMDTDQLKTTHTFYGRLNNVRIFSYYSNESNQHVLSRIWLKNAKVEIIRDRTIGYENIKTVYTDNEGFIIDDDGSRDVDFTVTSTKNSVDI